MNNHNEFENLSRSVRMAAVQYANELGVGPAAEKLLIGRDALGRICAGLPTRRGTIMTAAAALGLIGRVPSALAVSSLPNAGEIG